MLFNTNVCNDPRSFMYYDSKYYINGTIVELSDRYISQNCFNGKKIWKYARFDHQINSSGVISYFFCAVKIDVLSLRDMGIDRSILNEYAQYFVISALDIHNAVSQIVKEIRLTDVECDTINQNLLNAIEHPKSDLEYQELMIAWPIYIIVLIFSLIFKQFYILWLLASIIFFKWRKDVLNG